MLEKDQILYNQLIGAVFNTPEDSLRAVEIARNVAGILGLTERNQLQAVRLALMDEGLAVIPKNIRDVTVFDGLAKAKVALGAYKTNREHFDQILRERSQDRKLQK